MPVSPAENAAGRISFEIKANGQVVDGIALVSADIEHRVNRISRADLVFNDADVALSEFELTDAETFKPGTEVTVGFGYEDDIPKVVFSGIVVAQSLAIGDGNEVRLRVDCCDKAVAMTLVRRNKVFSGQTDSNIMSTLVNNAGLRPQIDATSVTFTNLVQYYVTDWDFLLTRAEANGFVVRLDDGKVIAAKPKLGSAVLSATYGSDLIAFDARVDAREQRESVAASTWEATTQKVVTQTGSAPGLKTTGPGDLSASTLATALRADDGILQTAAVSQDILKTWADGAQLRRGLARNRAEVTFQGSALAKVGDTLELKNLGKRFSGDAYIGCVRHRIEGGSWLTTVETGLEPDIHADRLRLADAPSAGLTAPIRGLQIGTVQNLAGDPDSRQRVKVTMPLLGADADAIWARLGGIYASNTFGVFIAPEIGDEVILGFLNQDPTEAVVLGSLYSSKHPPAVTFEDANNTKSILTREKMKIEFDEEKKIITVETPGGNKAVFDDQEKTVTLTDQTGNSVELATGGITLDSKGDVTIKATGKVDIQATGDFSASGMNASMEGEIGATVKGSATAEISASGALTVKGAIVKIN